MAWNLKATAIGEIRVLPRTVKWMNFLSVYLRVEHTIFPEMVCRAFLFERIA